MPARSPLRRSPRPTSSSPSASRSTRRSPRARRGGSSRARSSRCCTHWGGGDARSSSARTAVPRWCSSAAPIGCGPSSTRICGRPSGPRGNGSRRSTPRAGHSGSTTPGTTTACARATPRWTGSSSGTTTRSRRRTIRPTAGTAAAVSGRSRRIRCGRGGSGSATARARSRRSIRRSESTSGLARW